MSICQVSQMILAMPARATYADGVAVSEGDAGLKLVGWRPGVAKGNDSVEAELVEVGRLELEHGLNTSVADLGTGRSNLLAAVVAERGLDELLAVLDKQIPDGLVADRGDLDELCEAVADLAGRQRPQEREVEEGVQRGVVRAESVQSAGGAHTMTGGHTGS